MKRNCNLKLELQPPVSDHDSSMEQHQQQQLTIFYDGQVCVCDVNEFQARAILLLASRELMGQKLKSPAASNSSGDGGIKCWENYAPATASPTTTVTGLSMKRSLQRFLQKRKRRSDVAAIAHPYHR